MECLRTAPEHRITQCGSPSTSHVQMEEQSSTRRVSTACLASSSRRQDRRLGSFRLLVVTVVCLLAACGTRVVAGDSSDEGSQLETREGDGRRKFLDDFMFTWGEEDIHEDSTAVLKIIDAQKKGAGWTSREPWLHGIFKAMIKVPKAPSCGVVTAFYLTSEWNTSWTKDLHDEIDFEFLGDDNSGEIQLQTNYFIRGKGNNEERLKLWFDPTLDFHEYKFQVNKDAVRWYVDDILVREITHETPGGLPTSSQFLVASIWDGAFWVPCTWGRKHRALDYSKAPYEASFRNVSIEACYWRQMDTKVAPECADPSYTYVWDSEPTQKDHIVHDYLREHHMIYTYADWDPKNPDATTTKPTKRKGNAYVESEDLMTSLEVFELLAEGKFLRGEPRSVQNSGTDTDRILLTGGSS